MLTRTAFVALARIAQGKPAFRTMLPPASAGGRRIEIAKARREAVAELVRLRYVRRTKTGPEITATGCGVLDALMGLKHGAELSVLGENLAAAAERYGVRPNTMSKRISRLREAVTSDPV